MNTDRIVPRCVWQTGIALALAGSALAQPGRDGPPTLTSPLSGGSPAPAGGAPGLGSGPGFHDPRSAFKPLEDKPGVVPWSTLSNVTTRSQKNRLVPVFAQPVKDLDKQVVKVQGFMMPLEPGDKQRHFLLSAVPTTCQFCVPAGPEGLVEVRSRTPVKYTLEPVVVEGRLAVLVNDPYGLYYRIADAQPAP
jgi:hypothetical protein